jgi:DNA repair protein RadC
MARLRTIQQLAPIDRPREKLVAKGTRALSDFELLEVIIGSGIAGADVATISRDIQKLLAKGIDSLTLQTLGSIKGVSVATASKLLAAIELSRRHLIQDSPALATTGDIVAHVHEIRAKQQEYLLCLSLDGAMRLIAQRTIAIGTLDTVVTHPREVFADAIADRAAAIVIVHNHPSDNPAPSTRDITLTQQLAAAGQLLGVTLYDHVIVSRSSHYSFRSEKLL